MCSSHIIVAVQSGASPSLPPRHMGSRRCIVSVGVTNGQYQGEIVLKNMTRWNAIQVWCAAVVVVAVAGFTVGVSVTAGTAAALMLLCLVAPVIILMLWPRELATTAGDVIHGVDRGCEK